MDLFRVVLFYICGGTVLFVSAVLLMSLFMRQHYEKGFWVDMLWAIAPVVILLLMIFPVAKMVFATPGLLGGM